MAPNSTSSPIAPTSPASRAAETYMSQSEQSAPDRTNDRNGQFGANVELGLTDQIPNILAMGGRSTGE